MIKDCGDYMTTILLEYEHTTPPHSQHSLSHQLSLWGYSNSLLTCSPCFYSYPFALATLTFLLSFEQAKLI